MSFSLVALNLKGIEGLLLEVSRCYGSIVLRQRYEWFGKSVNGYAFKERILGICRLGDPIRKAYHLESFTFGHRRGSQFPTLWAHRCSSCVLKGSRESRDQFGCHGGRQSERGRESQS